jgi:hypothetical protein
VKKYKIPLIFNGWITHCLFNFCTPKMGENEKVIKLFQFAFEGIYLSHFTSFLAFNMSIIFGKFLLTQAPLNISHHSTFE